MLVERSFKVFVVLEGISLHLQLKEGNSYISWAGKWTECKKLLHT